jgi:hypothetical protein
MSTAFDYAAFIDELRELVVRAREFRHDERSPTEKVASLSFLFISFYIR